MRINPDTFGESWQPRSARYFVDAHDFIKRRIKTLNTASSERDNQAAIPAATADHAPLLEMVREAVRDLDVCINGRLAAHCLSISHADLTAMILGGKISANHCDPLMSIDSTYIFRNQMAIFLYDNPIFIDTFTKIKRRFFGRSRK